MLKSLAKSLLRARGLELKPIGGPVRGPDNYIAHLKAKGFKPGTVIDIGVAKGTPWLYRFPDAKLVLIEPNPAFEPDLQRIAAEHQADILPYAAGVDPGVLTLNVDLHAPSSSSFYAASAEVLSYWRDRGRSRATTTRKVEVQPLDLLIDERYRPPFLIKIDTEGFELEVLKGAIQTLTRTACLVVETSVARRYEGSYAFAELIAYLDTHGFALSDLLDVQSFDGDGDISYMDIAFMKNTDTRNTGRARKEHQGLQSVSQADGAFA